jgi:EAL domain-containing protein (putative c-di-GMP-specific phosphodiesterase class I)
MKLHTANRRQCSGHILVADDEPELRRAFGRILRHVGYEVDEAPSGSAAQDLLDGRAFDAVLSDISMPDMTGLDVLRHARGKDADLPVVLVTGGPAVETAVEAIEYGAYRYLIKPISAKDLIATVDKAVLLYRMARVRRDAAAKMGTEDRVKLEAAFDRALAGIWMAYQPIVRADGSLYGYEALLRSNEPELPNPGKVLEAAERLGRVADLGRVVRTATAETFGKAPESAALFVNLHPRDMLDDGLLAPDAPLASLSHRVVLEITERASLGAIADVRGRVEALRARGFRVAIDDLGAGYAGLSSFSLLEPEVVKIDMDLVRDVDKNSMKRKLVASMASVCKEMGMLVVGEGVETVAERDTLIELGCPLLQGYLFGRPAPLP